MKYRPALTGALAGALNNRTKLYNRMAATIQESKWSPLDHRLAPTLAKSPHRLASTLAKSPKPDGSHHPRTSEVKPAVAGALARASIRETKPNFPRNAKRC